MPSNIRWIGNGQNVAQVNTITVGGTPALNQVYTVTINGKNVTYTATGTDTNITIAAALVVALAAASVPPEFREETWTNAAGTAIVLGTSRVAGRPFTQTSSATGTGTLVTSTTTANSSASDWNNTANWSTGAVPITGDSVFIDNSNVPILYGLNQSAVTLAAMTIAASYTGPTAQIGLPEWNGTGQNQYREYRGTYLQIGVTTLTIGNGSGSGCNLIKINAGSVATTATVYLTGRQVVEAGAGLEFLGTNAANILNVFGGNVAVAPDGTDLATLATLRLAAGGNQTNNVFCGTGVTLTTVQVEAGNLSIQTGATTVKLYGGTLSIEGSGAYTTMTIDAGSVSCAGTGTISTLNLTGSIDFSGSEAPMTVSTMNLFAGHNYSDPGGRVAVTSAVYNNAGSLSGRTNFGFGRTLTVA